MKNLIVLFLICTSCSLTLAQTPIDLVEGTIKISALSEELYYFGMKEGDELIFNLEELKGKPIKEVEISEYGRASLFMDFKTKKIENKVLKITKTGIYKFRFWNSAVACRICKYKIQRIPLTDSLKSFNSTVYWKDVHDTTYYTVQEKYLVSKDTSIYKVTDQVSKVHSSGNLNGNKTTFNFTLPQNTVSWSYYIGVDQAGQQAYEKASADLAKNVSPILAKMPGYGPLAALALNGTSYLTQLQRGEDIDYYLVLNDNVNLFLNSQAFNYLKKGKVINDFARMENAYKGNYHFCFKNDNAITGVTVTIKITAIVVKDNWGTRDVEKYKVKTTRVPYLEESK